MKEGVVLLDKEKSIIQKNLRTFVDEYQKYIEEQDAWCGVVDGVVSASPHLQLNRKMAIIVMVCRHKQRSRSRDAARSRRGRGAEGGL